MRRPQVTFGVNNTFIPGTQWIIARSTTLQPGTFTEIFRFNGTAYTFTSAQVAVVGAPLRKRGRAWPAEVSLLRRDGDVQPEEFLHVG